MTLASPGRDLLVMQSERWDQPRPPMGSPSIDGSAPWSVWRTEVPPFLNFVDAMTIHAASLQSDVDRPSTVEAKRLPEECANNSQQQALSHQ